ncbi:ABC transporter ATP-binding protein [Alkalibacter rhizosphaerae]|uniref:ABC transporter ATP-binding protein n=1 Tax=Alkalibacter rhizosphaerae TaxID=2815577 RepID=A0A974XHL0_9FIRM|nr:ABC transporter ATP-binding protein [Alkalibacter rhizosphaerae]QSX08508.1 ABC transporter ATP-binding protein [Alkalibacter rhizosphaerae]
MEPLIELSNINKTYGKEPNKVFALKNVSMTIDPGEFVAILGPSGSGKTTLMNIIGLIDKPDNGTYFIDGLDMKKQPDSIYSVLRNQKIGFVFQKFNLIAKYDALYNVALPLLYRGHRFREAKQIATETLERVGLGDRQHHRPNELSGGQQQRVAIARALVGSSPLILADEPTGALDKKTGEEILDLFEVLNQQGKTIVMITHDMNIAGKAKRVIKVEDGNVIS